MAALANNSPPQKVASANSCLLGLFFVLPAYDESKKYGQGRGMEIWKAAVLGIVQGACEFLPVSSSGHLLLFERLLGADTGGADMFLGVMLHAGTLAAVVAAYLPKLLRLRLRQWLLLALATLPAGLAGVFLHDALDALFFGGRFLWLSFACTALLLLACERRLRRGYPIRSLQSGRALFVGCAQALAVIPGLSRSGTTFAAGVLCGMPRAEAAEFSLLLGIPVVAGAVLAECCKAAAGAVNMSAVSWQCLAAGGLCAAITGFVSLRLTLRAAASGKVYLFAFYLIALSAALLAFRFFSF